MISSALRLVEQDHRRVKRRGTARRTLGGMEAMAMLVRAVPAYD
jgi:transposase-like protein